VEKAFFRFDSIAVPFSKVLTGKLDFVVDSSNVQLSFKVFIITVIVLVKF